MASGTLPLVLNFPICKMGTRKTTLRVVVGEYHGITCNCIDPSAWQWGVVSQQMTPLLSPPEIKRHEPLLQSESLALDLGILAGILLYFFSRVNLGKSLTEVLLP